MFKKETAVAGVGDQGLLPENLEFAGSVLESWPIKATYRELKNLLGKEEKNKMENPKLLGLRMLKDAGYNALFLAFGMIAALDDDFRLELVDGMQVMAQKTGRVPFASEASLLLFNSRDRHLAYQQILWGMEHFNRRSTRKEPSGGTGINYGHCSR